MGQDEKEKKPKKASHGLRMVLRILQHTALAVVALSLLVVTLGSTVRIQGFRDAKSYSLYASDQDKKYEESELFNNIFGYAMADIIRDGVVSSQLETDGEFDGMKVVDVTAYNYRGIGLPEQYVTADYYLEDLLKWANYGYEYSNITLAEAEEKGFLADRTRVTTVDQNSQYYNTSDASYLKSDIGSYTFVSDVSANQLVTSGTDPVLEAYDGYVEGYGDELSGTVTEESQMPEENGYGEEHAILINRYKTVEGKNIEEYVSNWELYDALCENVTKAAESLSYNYSEYQEYKDYYNADKSNVRYMIAKTVGDNTQYYSNIEEKAEKESILQIMSGKSVSREEQDVLGKYIYYSPSEMIYQTNTAIAESTVRKVVQEYDYAYPENVKIWIAVDTSYPVSDAFTQGAAGFRNYLPYFWQWVCVAVVSGALYLFLLIYLTLRTGKDIDEEGKPYIRLTAFDKVPTEAGALIGFGVAVLMIWVLVIVTELFSMDITSLYSNEMVYQNWFKLFLLISIFLADTVFTFFFYSLVRRIKAKQLWKNSFLYRLIRKCITFGWDIYDNGNLVVRTWGPFVLYILFHILIVLWAISSGGILPVIIVIVGDILVGMMLYRDAKERQGIVEGIQTIADGEIDYQVETDNLHGDNRTLADSVNSIGKGIKEAVEISMKDERMKADLITNVSHDIKTPLTSIINYVDLIKREKVDNQKVQNYIRVLDEKSQRLKQLTDDLVEASKITSGNISLTFERINLTELMNQTIGEFSEKFEEKNLTTIMNVNAANVMIEADSRRIWRVMENLFNNIYKYALPGTRVYVSIDSIAKGAERIAISIKNISASPLNCNPEELTERFIRGDVSRTTEGSGLGLSIAKNLTIAQKGTFEIQLDGDLFKILMTFPLAKEEVTAPSEE